MPSLKDLIESKVRYVTLMEGCGCSKGSDKHNTLLQSAIAGILQAVSISRKVDVEDAIAVKSIVEGHFTDSQIETIMSAVNQKVSLVKVSTTCVGRQINYCWDSYLTASLWEFCQSPVVHTQQKLMATAEHMRLCGLVSCDEKTYAFVAAIATHCILNDGPTLLQHARDLKELVRCNKDEVTHLPDEFPRTTDEFQAQYPILYGRAFATEPPVPSKLSDMQRQMILRLVPCRSTKSGCESMRSFAVQGPIHPRARPAINRGPSLESLPGFRWTNRPPPPALTDAVASTMPGMFPQPDVAFPSPPPSGAPRRLLALEAPPTPSPTRDSPTVPFSSFPARESPLSSPAQSSITASPTVSSSLVLHEGPLAGTRSMDAITNAIKVKLGKVDAMQWSVETAADGDEKAKPPPKKSMKARPPPKKSMKIIVSIMKKPAAPPTTMKKPAATQDTVADSDLRYSPDCMGPWSYKGQTVYISIPLRQYRVKPGRGRRDLKAISWKTQSRKQAWEEAVKHVKQECKRMQE
jgi:hypothetical protein